MANTDITSRTQYERTDLRAGGESIRRGSERAAAIYTVIALVVGALLSAVAVATIENWSQWLVLGVIIVTTLAIAFAIGPNRGGAGSKFETSR